MWSRPTIHCRKFLTGHIWYWVFVDKEGLVISSVIYTDFSLSLSCLVPFSPSIHHAFCFRLFLQASLYSNTFAPLWKYSRYPLKIKLKCIWSFPKPNQVVLTPKLNQLWPFHIVSYDEVQWDIFQMIGITEQWPVPKVWSGNWNPQLGSGKDCGYC